MEVILKLRIQRKKECLLSGIGMAPFPTHMKEEASKSTVQGPNGFFENSLHALLHCR